MLLLTDTTEYKRQQKTAKDEKEKGVEGTQVLKHSGHDVSWIYLWDCL